MKELLNVLSGLFSATDRKKMVEELNIPEKEAKKLSTREIHRRYVNQKNQIMCDTWAYLIAQLTIFQNMAVFAVIVIALEIYLGATNPFYAVIFVAVAVRICFDADRMVRRRNE